VSRDSEALSRGGSNGAAGLTGDLFGASMRTASMRVVIVPPRFEGLPTASSQNGPSEWVLLIDCLTSREGRNARTSPCGHPTRRDRLRRRLAGYDLRVAPGSIGPNKRGRAAGRHASCCGSLSVLGMAANKDEGDLERLRILVSDGKGHRLEEVTHTVTGLGHEVAGHSSLRDVAASTASIRPDAAIVIVGESSEHALELIGRTVTEAACPVIAILDVEDEAFIRDAAKRGIFAYITMGREAAALQSALDVVLSRFAEYQGLEGAFGRRAITERAKGILMERHSVDEKLAFEMLRDEARRSNRKIIEIAEAVTVSANLLPRLPVE
jgi:AmiR/NasT family two-component response regulator